MTNQNNSSESEVRSLAQKSYIYILECCDNSLYTGWTNDLKLRCKVHQSGHGAKYTRTRIPVKLVYYEEFVDRGSAMRREVEIKAMPRHKKLELISQMAIPNFSVSSLD